MKNHTQPKEPDNVLICYALCFLLETRSASQIADIMGIDERHAQLLLEEVDGRTDHPKLPGLELVG